MTIEQNLAIVTPLWFLLIGVLVLAGALKLRAWFKEYFPIVNRKPEAKE